MSIYQARYTQSHALLIGIDNYLHFPPLATAVKGVRELAEVLADELDFDPARIITLQDDQATQRAILSALNDPLSVRDKVGPDDRVLIYFAGHGTTFDTAEGEIGCIVPYDAEKNNIYTTIEMDRLTRLANRFYAKHVLFLLDACFSGFATTRDIDPGVERQLEDFLTQPSRQVITAGTRKQRASDYWGPGGHSLFTGFLITGLRGATPAPGGVLRAFHLAGYLQDEVATHSRSRQTPQYAALLGSEGGDFILNVREVVELPQWVLAAADSADPTQRLVAVGELRDLVQEAQSPQLVGQALAKLQELAAQDPDFLVRSSAQTVLHELVPETDIAPVEREKTIIVQPPHQAEAQKEPVPVPAPPESEAPPPARQPGHAAQTLKTTTVPAPAGIGRLWIGIGGALLAVALLVGLVGSVYIISKLVKEGGSGATPEPMHEETAQPTIDPAVISLATSGVSTNDQWEPYIRQFDGVQMALVPAGCFMMGSWVLEEEQPVHQLCFDDPFWIDVTEVTNMQFRAFDAKVGRNSSTTGDQYPRERITWFEAVQFCELRGARLPTEAEWEYTARGPDALVYPWGNAFDGMLLNFCDANCDEAWADKDVDDGHPHTAPAGTYPGGASWVGALDMSGNVWEWANSIHLPYPYDATDGRETDGQSNGDSERVLLGGSWSSTRDGVRAANRYKGDPTGGSDEVGFRCLRDYEPPPSLAPGSNLH